MHQKTFITYYYPITSKQQNSNTIKEVVFVTLQGLFTTKYSRKKLSPPRFRVPKW